jgi:hypothetical protein
MKKGLEKGKVTGKLFRSLEKIQNNTTFIFLPFISLKNIFEDTDEDTEVTLPK